MYMNQQFHRLVKNILSIFQEYYGEMGGQLFCLAHTTLMPNKTLHRNFATLRFANSSELGRYAKKELLHEII